MRFTGIISLIATTQATWEVIIHNNKWEKALERVAQDGQEMFNSTAFQEYMHRMDEAEMKARVEIDASQKAIWQPVTKGMRDYLHWFTPIEKDCDVDTMTQCMLEKVHVEDQETDHDWILCGQRSNCSASWDSLSFDKKMKLEHRFGKTSKQLQKALVKLNKEIKSDYAQAYKEQAKNIQAIKEDFAEDVEDSMVHWGCNETCVDKQNITSADWCPVKAFEQCDCPYGGEVYVKTPAGEVRVAAEIPESSENLISALKVKFNSTGYTFIVVCIFLGQIALVIYLKYWYLRRAYNNADKKFWNRATKWSAFQEQYLGRCKAEREAFKSHLQMLDTTAD